MLKQIYPDPARGQCAPCLPAQSVLHFLSLPPLFFQVADIVVTNSLFELIFINDNFSWGFLLLLRFAEIFFFHLRTNFS
jgi:hypothetical protein